MNDLAQAAAWMRGARRVLVFTGAGISAESGIDTFRSASGLWATYPPEQFATVRGLTRLATRNPRRLARFLRAVVEPVARARPNPGHAALVALEQALVALGGQLTVVTQNIDGLHQEAGSSAVLEVHGSLFEIVALSGQLRRRLTREQLQRVAVQLAGVEDSVFALPRLFQAINPLLGLSIDVVHRPSIVLFGEALAEPAWGRALSECAACDLMLVVGTSGAVHPAAGLPDLAARRGVRVVGVGPEAGTADLWLHGPAGAVLPELVRSVQASA